MKKIITVVASIILIVVISALILLKGKKEPKFKLEPVIKTSITKTVEASGTINPVTTVDIGTQVSGMISKIYVDYNSVVKKGQLLAEIDPSLFQAQVDQANASIQNARANYSKVLATMENDRKTYIRYQNLYKKNFVAKSELDLAQSTFLADSAQLNAARASIAQARATLETANSNLRYTKIVSSIDGVVITKSVDVGQTVAASFSTPTLFEVAQNLKKMQIETNVSEADIGGVRIGQEAEYTLDGYPDQTFKGKVTQVRMSPTTVSNVVTYNVIVQVENPYYNLRPGMNANVLIVTQKLDNILAVPNSCVRFTPYTEGDGPKFKDEGVWVIGENKKPKRVNAKFGISDENNTQIISKELKEGDMVISGFEDENKKSKKQQMKMRMF